MRSHLNPEIFLYFDGGEVILWDYRNHQQFSVDEEHLCRLLELVRSGEPPNSSSHIDAELIKAGVISNDALVGPDWGWDVLSRMFHYGTRDIPQEFIPENAQDWARTYVAACQELVGIELADVQLNTNDDHCLRLTSPIVTDAAGSKTLWESLQQRKTCRHFFERPVDQSTLSCLLHFALGDIPERQSSVHEYVPSQFRMRRSSPSGGGLNATSAFLLARNVDGIEPGVYRYNPDGHTLSVVNGKLHLSDVSFGELFLGQHFADTLPFGIFLVGEFNKMWWKYPHSRAYRVSLLEVGHISQTFQLAATSLKLNTWLTAAFQDSKVDSLLGLTSPAKQPLLFVGAGYSDGSSLDCARRNVLESVSHEH